MTDFTGKVVLITGAASGIGLAAVRAFSVAGATVEGWDLRPENIARAQQVLAADRIGGACFTRVDVSNASDVDRAAAALAERHGRVDVLVNNAGINRGDQAATRLSERTLREMLEVNLEGTANCVRRIAPLMVTAGSGVIISSSSVLARSPVPGMGAYAATKAGIAALSRAWARELGPSGIRVNTVAPGFIDTPMNDGLPEPVRQALVANSALRRMGRAEEVANVLVFLASDAASFITGAELAVDGGLLV